MTKVTPYNNSESKKKQVTKMFDNIAESYDFLNHSLSLGMDNVWRKIAIKKLVNNPNTILDIATGTGDFAISASKHTNAQISGIDIIRISNIILLVLLSYIRYAHMIHMYMIHAYDTHI